ncbi:Transcription elongation factor B polypeptide 2 [Cricetulus griseus]|uniref:Transcription elongation factor B polypeptide 2 n=1 Tax=Cricetulus griseus TaxID=10029 RepID=G3GS83_CRIGR|nr:Transcription elongation factor B polypeptide 2 [Cricetulus griseus]
MDEFLMIWHHKTTILTDAKESSTVFELKHILEGILKRPPMCSGCTRMTSSLMMEKLGECGFTSQTAGPQAQPQWAWPSEQMPLKPCALSPSPVLQSFQM